MKKHLAIFKDNIGDLILNGQKTIESRFSLHKTIPFGAISVGDLVYIKPSGKDIIGQFRVKKVIFYEGLTTEDFKNIKQQYEKQLKVDGYFWKSKINSKYGTLIFIDSPQGFLTSPLKIEKKDLRGWVILDPPAGGELN